MDPLLPDSQFAPVATPKPGILSDIGHGLKIGADVAAQDVRELVGRVPIIGQRIVSALDKVDALTHAGISSETLLNADVAAQTAAMSTEQQAAGQKRWDTLGEDSAWRDWRSYTGGLAQSLPEQAAMMFPAMRLAKGAAAVSMARATALDVEARVVGSAARIAAEKAAGMAAARTATVAGGAIEGALGGAQSSREVRDSINALPEKELQDSSALQALESSGLSFEQARAQLADDASTKAFFLSGIATGIFGGMGDRVLAKAMTGQLKGGILSRVGKGAVSEGVLEELPQSALQQTSQNLAMRDAVPSTPLGKDVANQALGGLAIGSIQGGAQTGVFGRSTAATPTTPADQLGAALEADIADRNFTPASADPMRTARAIFAAPDDVDAIVDTAMAAVSTPVAPRLEADVDAVVNSIETNSGDPSAEQAARDTHATEVGAPAGLPTVGAAADNADVLGGSEAAVGGPGLPAGGVPGQQLYTDGEPGGQQSTKLDADQSRLNELPDYVHGFERNEDGTVHVVIPAVVDKDGVEIEPRRTVPVRAWREDSLPDGVAGAEPRARAAAQRDHYGKLGLEVVFYEDNEDLPDGFVISNKRGTLLLSNDPQRNAAQIAAHEAKHAMEGLKAPDGKTYNRILVEAAQVTNAGWLQTKLHAQTAPNSPQNPDGTFDPADAEAHADQSLYHLVNELLADVGGEAPKFKTFMPQVFAAIEAKYDGKVAGAVIKSFIKGIDAAYQAVRKFFGNDPTVSQTWVKNLPQLHGILQDMHVAQYGTQLEKEIARAEAGRAGVQQYGTQLEKEKARIEAGRAGVQQSAKSPDVRAVTAIRARTPEFKKWFGKSKVVAGGKPLVVYHGTEQDFEAPNGRFWATDAPATAETYANGRVNRSKGQGAAIIPAHLSLQNPLVVDADGMDWDEIRFRGAVRDTDDIADIAQKEGHDGVIIRNVFDAADGEGGLATTYAAFRPEQVKSVFNPRPTNNPSMSLSPKSEAAKIEASRAKDQRTGVALTKAMRSATLDEYLYGDRLPFNVSTQAELGEILQEMGTTYAPARTEDTSENREFVARVVEHEVRLALGMDGNAVGWYAVGRYSHTIAAPIRPKIGANRDALAMDRWFMRTWGRITGNLVYKKDGETFTRDAPGSGGERHYIRATMKTALERLRKDHPSLTMGDLQAVLRYEEKDLYTLHNVNDEEPTDYAIETANYAKTRGLDAAAVDNARDASGTEGEVAGGRSAQFSPKKESAASYGQGRDGAVTVTGVHYSLAQRATLDSRHYGTGIKGAEAARIGNLPNSLYNRTYFYVNEGRGVHPESGVGRHAHSVNLRNVYDTDADPLGLATKANGSTNKFEASVQAAGFDGYYVRAGLGQQGAAVLIGDHSVAPEYHGTKYDAREMTPPAAPVYSDTEQKARSIAYDKSLPDGEMTGSDWKKVLGDRAAGLKIQDDKTYYKSDLGKLVRDSAQFSVKRAHNAADEGRTAGAADGSGAEGQAAQRSPKQEGSVDLVGVIFLGNNRGLR